MLLEVLPQLVRAAPLVLGVPVLLREVIVPLFVKV
jgi:hypothetical protein